MKKYWFLILLCLLFMPKVDAEVISLKDEYASFGININGYTGLPQDWYVGANTYRTLDFTLYNYEGVSRPYTYVLFSLCSQGHPSHWYLSNTSTKGYFNEQSFQAVDGVGSCLSYGSGYQPYFIQFQVAQYQDMDGTGEELMANTNILLVNPSSAGYATYFSNMYLSSEDVISAMAQNQDVLDAFADLENGLVGLEEGLDSVNSAINSTNSKLDTQIQQNEEAEKTRKGIWETIKNLPSAFLDMLLGLFIPDDMDFLNDFVDALEDKLGFIASIPIQIIEFVTTLLSSTWETFDSITLPSIEVFGYKFWNSQEIDLTEAINIFKPFKYVTDVICVVICARTLNKWRETFSGGGSGE